MNFRKTTLCILSLLAMFASCKKDDDGGGIQFVEADRTEQQVIDGDSLIGYLETHFYNSAYFLNPGDYSYDEIIITELPKDSDGNFLPMPNPSVNTLLIDAVETKTTTYLDVDYVFYILKINEGGGESPNFSDDVLTNYSGFMQDGEVFDNTVNAQSPFNLLDLVQGWRLVMPSFKSSESFVVNGDGTLNYSNYGLGVMFLPSGLGYFGSPPGGINSYANIIFKFELYQTAIKDHDLDLIPSYLEDLNGNGNLFDDDTDGDNIPDYLDRDDDGDGTLTRNEDLDNDGNPLNDDSDGDSIPNYLDTDSRDSNQG